MSLMRCKWKNFDANYLQNLSPDLFEILQVTVTSHQLPHISQKLSKGNSILLQQELIEVWNSMPVVVLDIASGPQSLEQFSTNTRFTKYFFVNLQFLKNYHANQSFDTIFQKWPVNVKKHSCSNT